MTCVGVFACAAVYTSFTLNLIGLGLYWLLDVADGYAARKLDQETRIGAQLDIYSDRLLIGFFYVNYVQMNPEAVVPAALMLLEFTVIDQYLSTQFLRWPIKSPNYFHHISKPVWKLNWSPTAKALNTAMVTLILLVTGNALAATIACAALIVVKLYSLVLMHRLRAPAGL
ncbi:MAG: CDP-alcohol phosphatidyltransferase family protein [Deltaproteobacteria bacterium]|nr:CDP-alcohol phosphatidyltransferase family protein [Deltaproteobacteria bacterium]